jgi:hypothetical protein
MTEVAISRQMVIDIGSLIARLLHYSRRHEARKGHACRPVTGEDCLDAGETRHVSRVAIIGRRLIRRPFACEADFPLPEPLESAILASK